MNKTRGTRLARAALLGATGLVALGVLGAGCTTETDEPRGAAGALEQATGVEWIVDTDPQTGAIVFAAPKSAPFALPTGVPAADAALAFLDAHKALFHMHDPKGELVVERAERTKDGYTHVRFLQKEGGVPVYGATWTAHVDSAGRLTSMSGTYFVDAYVVATTPKLTPDGAAAVAKAEATRRTPSISAAALDVGEPSLEVFPVKGATPVLAWAVSVKSKMGASPIVGLRVHVEDVSSKVLLATSSIVRRTATARPPQSYPPYDVDAPPLSFPISEDDPPRLEAKGPGGVDMSVYTLRDPENVDDAALVVGTSAEPWSDPTTPPGAAIAAQAHAKIVLDYYAEHENPRSNGGDGDGGAGQWRGSAWLSVDGKGAVPIKQHINVNGLGDGNGGVFDVRNNAFWSADFNGMFYGDGIAEQLEWPTTASLDTVAHELTHGVTQFASRLSIDPGTESAAINESISDIFAALITHRTRNDDAVDFTFMEDANSARVPARSMIQPTLSSLLEAGGISVYSDFKGDKTESHLASNISSHAFYLLTHGGTHETTRVKVPCGIGWGAADRLYWRLQTSYMQPSETFKNLALHGLAAARELGINTTPVACAWVAVGVLSDDDAKKDWNVTCERDGDGGADAGYDSGNILVTAPAQLVECPVSLTGGGVSLGGGGGGGW